MRLASRDNKLEEQLLGRSLYSPMKESDPENSLSKQDVSSGIAPDPQTNNLRAPKLPAIPNANLQLEEGRLWDWCKSKLLEIKGMPQAAGFLEPVDWKKLKLPLTTD